MKKMKRLLALVLCIAMLLSGCATKAPDTTAVAHNVPVKLLAMSSDEKTVNVVRDQLTKAGFAVELNIQPDYSSMLAQLEAGNFDINISGWTTVTGNPDYAVRSLFKTGGDYNRAPMSDPEIDALIDLAATQTAEEYKQTYTDLENKLVTENAYIVPLNGSIKPQAVNKTILKPDSVLLSKSRSMNWEYVDFVDEAKRATTPLMLAQATGTLTSLDPIKGNDGSINMLNTNMYVRLVNLTTDDVVTSTGSLSRNHAIAEGNKEYYFVLRDDINFAKIDNKVAVDTGERVGAEDVVFSLNRAKDKNSVPDHRTFSLHESMETIEIVTNLDEIATATQSGVTTTIKEALEKDLAAPITSLVADKTKANNGNGAYQVVKVITKNPFPQVLNYLAHQSAGIVSEKQIKAVNTYDVAAYDRNKDVAYGDQNAIAEGSAYNNTLYASGPYILTSKNDYEIRFVKNPAYMVGTNEEPRIENITVKVIQDTDSQLSAFRSGEVHALYTVPENKYSIVEQDPNMVLKQIPANSASYLLFNMNGDTKGKNINYRKSIMYAINQDEINAVYEGKRPAVYSTVTPLVNTGNKLVQDIAKSQEHAQLFLDETK